MQTLPLSYRAAFKDADIRGLYGTEVDEVVAYRVARAFVSLFSLTKVIVSRDMRVSSPALAAAFIAGVRDQGATALDIGLIDTPGLYFSSGTLQLPGVMITASHNPAQYNGLKLVFAGAIPLTKNTGLRSIQHTIEKNEFTPVSTHGAIQKKSMHREYMAYIKKKVPIDAPRPLRVVVDAGNGMGSSFIELLKKHPAFSVTELFCTLDGTFPNRGSNPTLRANQKPIMYALKAGEYDFGVAFDGDADRAAFFDARGRYINAAQIGALLAAHILSIYPKSAHVYTVFTSHVYKETIRASGGKAVRARVGHAFIKEMMHKRDAVFGCEHSGHFYFKDNFCTDSGILAFLYVAAAYAHAIPEGKSFAQFLKPFKRYTQTEEVLVTVANKRAVLAQVVAQYATQEPLGIEMFDGVTIRFAEYWLVVRQSVTEDALEFIVESPDAHVALAKQKELHTFLRRFAVSA